MSTSLVEDQPSPTPNHRAEVWPLVIDDMRSRDSIGRKRYGTPLQPFNGRDALVDAYQEALDLVVYLRQAIEERRSRWLPLLRTSRSGNMLFVCKVCGRISKTPDKQCGTPAEECADTWLAVRI